MSTKTPFPGFPGLSRDLRRVQAGVMQNRLTELTTDDDVDYGTIEERLAVVESLIGQHKIGDGTIAEIIEEIVPKVEASYKTTTTPGMAAKVSAIKTHDDEVPEDLSNKHLILPIINDSGAGNASCSITDDGAFSIVVIAVIATGTDGNLWTAITDANATETVAVDTDAKTVTLREGATGNEIVDWYINTNEGVAAQTHLKITLQPGTGTLEVAEIDSAKSFTGGSAGHQLVATSTEIDNAVDQAPASGAPALPVTAKLTTGDAGSEINWEADVAGKAGDDIRLTFEVPATSLSVATNTAASEIILTAVKGVHPVSITLLGGLSQSLAVSAVGSDITVQLATDGSSAITSTAADVLAAILAAMATGQPLNGILSSAVGGASYVGTTLMLTQAIDYFDATADIVVDVSEPLNIIASVMYDGATNTPISTATAMKNAVSLASELITGTVTGTGNDPVAEITEGAFTGGKNGTPGVAGAIRYEANKLWISAGISTIAVSNWKYADLT